MTMLPVVDILLLLLLGVSAWRGWHAGFVRGTIELGVWLGSFVLALRFYDVVAAWLSDRVAWSELWIRPVAFLAVALISGLILGSLGSALIARLPRRVHSWTGNRLLGLVPGLVNGLISAAILSALLLALPLPPAFANAVQESQLVGTLATAVDRVELAVEPVFGEALSRSLNLLTIEPQSQERIELPFTVTDPLAAPALEAEMLELVNRARAEAGLAPLAADPALAEVARQHSADMLARGYFSHMAPEGRSPFERIAAAGITFRAAGENLALAPTIDLAHAGLMESPGHRANILSPQFGRVGIGVLDAGPRGLMVTQNFRD